MPKNIFQLNFASNLTWTLIIHQLSHHFSNILNQQIIKIRLQNYFFQFKNHQNFFFSLERPVKNRLTHAYFFFSPSDQWRHEPFRKSLCWSYLWNCLCMQQVRHMGENSLWEQFTIWSSRQLDVIWERFIANFCYQINLFFNYK